MVLSLAIAAILTGGGVGGVVLIVRRLFGGEDPVSLSYKVMDYEGSCILSSAWHRTS
jgi:hypothetical protein